jgi:hypothetical protein
LAGDGLLDDDDDLAGALPSSMVGNVDDSIVSISIKRKSWVSYESEEVKAKQGECICICI